jgi:F-type H+-transporting ATPase subunit c
MENEDMNRLAKNIGLVLVTMMVAAVAFAEEHAGGGAGMTDNNAWYAIAAAIAIALPAFGGAFAQGRAASAALEGIARNPGAAGKIFTPMILGLALIESLVIYGLVIAFVLSGKIS